MAFIELIQKLKKPDKLDKPDELMRFNRPNPPQAGDGLPRRFPRLWERRIN
ncbi:MAG: hypothetical protein QMD07_07705 [Thermodesulfovibrionales bacterium]|nr:hypothetical protein [Thermodesulfovibrionales bacterium]